MTRREPRWIAIGVVQCGLTEGPERNVARIEELVRRAAERGAGIVVMPELFEGSYFPQAQREEAFARARPRDGHPTLDRFRKLARELGVVLPISFFERAGHAFYNSVEVVDADGSALGIYRKSHIPDGPGYQEKFYFRPGETGFRVWSTRYGSLGVGICWDQWFPEAARAMALQGAEVLLYPTAIGSEPDAPELDTRAPWQRAMVGHAVSNALPVAAANRIGREEAVTFYGSSFVADARGERVVQLAPDEEGVGVASFDREELDRYRASWGFFRDRRPELYRILSGDDPGDSHRA